MFIVYSLKQQSKTRIYYVRYLNVKNKMCP